MSCVATHYRDTGRPFAPPLRKLVLERVTVRGVTLARVRWVEGRAAG